MLTDKPQMFKVHGGSAAVNRGADFVQYRDYNNLISRHNMEDAFQSSFERKKNAPLWWYNKPSDLHASAGALWLTIKGDNSKTISKLDFSKGFSMPVAWYSVTGLGSK